jgi:hypothetical protein
MKVMEVRWKDINTQFVPCAYEIKASQIDILYHRLLVLIVAGSALLIPMPTARYMKNAV